MKRILPILLLAGCLPVDSNESPAILPAMKPPVSVQNMPVPPPDRSLPVEETGRARTLIPSPAETPKPHPLTGLLCGKDRHDLYMRFWPRGKEAERVRQSQPVLFYDEETMPSVYQVFDMGLSSGIFRTNGPQATANREFPWNLPAGIPSGSNVKTIRFIQIPTGKPVLWWRSTYSDGTFSRFRWQFQPGTRLGEILLVTDSRGFDRTFEMRTRAKASDGTWKMQAYKPFASRIDLEVALEDRGFVLPSTSVMSRSVNSAHQRNGFVASAIMTAMPAMTEALVNDLLDNADFEPASGITWDIDVVAPTAVNYSVVPISYIGSFIPVDNSSCMRCHQDAGRVVNLAGEQRWRLRGDDGIFSFHPFAPESIGSNNLRLNKRLVDAGLLRHMEGMP